MAGKAGRVTYLVFQILFFALSSLSFVLYAVIVRDFLSACVTANVEGGWSGLGVAVALILMVIAAIVVAVLSLVSLIISIFMLKRRENGKVGYGIASVSLNSAYLVFTVIGCPLTILLYKLGILG